MKYPRFSLLCFSNVFRKKSPQKQRQSGRNISSGLPEGICREFSLAEIRAATNNFLWFIGKGGSGNVFMGTIDDGSIDVAVKFLADDSLSRGTEQFRTEIRLLCQLRHPHLVSLIGFCIDQNEMIVVYEYVSRGSLKDHLYGKDYVQLNWKQRLEICIGAARGLHYLHTGAKRAIIHRDINSANILLDDAWSPKISDFGLSKIGPLSMSKALIRMESIVTGSPGYLDPEYYRTQYVSEKSDVYSFGVVLFEVLCGRQPIVFSNNMPMHLPQWACQIIRNGTIYDIIDPHLKGEIAPECLEQFVEIAFSCLKDSGNERPSMGEVETTLELALELQNKANPLGDDYVYEDLQFCETHGNGGNAMDTDRISYTTSIGTSVSSGSIAE